jgi:hypothetical protein
VSRNVRTSFRHWLGGRKGRERGKQVCTVQVPNLDDPGFEAYARHTTQSAIQWVPVSLRRCIAAGACSWPLIFIQVRASEWMELYVFCPMCLFGMVKNQLTLTFMVNPRGDFDKGVHEHRVIIFRHVCAIAKNNY